MKEKIEKWNATKRQQPLQQPKQQVQAQKSIDSIKSDYLQQLKPLQFDELAMRDEKTNEYIHHFKSRISQEILQTNSNKMKRLLQELSSLSNGLPLFWESSVFVRVDDERIDVMKVLIIGPSGTPYENGCFLFDVYCPPEYPEVPPVVNLQTTGGGSVRFNPNLYNCGKVCLSLLGTWTGNSNEKWNSKTSTLLQVFISIQSLILVEQPYFNEPGYESQMGTQAGNQKSNEYNEIIKMATVRWAMLEQIRNSPKGFEKIIQTHFRLKKKYIIEQTQRWITEEAKNSSSKLKPIVDDFVIELVKLTTQEEEENQNATNQTKQELSEVSNVNQQPNTSSENQQTKNPNATKAEYLQNIFGYPLDICTKALELNALKTEEAANWLLENGEAMMKQVLQKQKGAQLQTSPLQQPQTQIVVQTPQTSLPSLQQDQKPQPPNQQLHLSPNQKGSNLNPTKDPSPKSGSKKTHKRKSKKK